MGKTTAKKNVEYRLRNEPEKQFSIDASAKGSGKKGSVIKALVKRYDEREFRYEVRFGGPFTETKDNFTADMYLETALNVVRSQIESHRHEDTLIVLEEASGLMDSTAGAKLDWEKP